MYLVIRAKVRERDELLRVMVLRCGNLKWLVADEIIKIGYPRRACVAWEWMIKNCIGKIIEYQWKQARVTTMSLIWRLSNIMEWIAVRSQYWLSSELQHTMSDDLYRSESWKGKKVVTRVHSNLSIHEHIKPFFLLTYVWREYKTRLDGLNMQKEPSRYTYIISHV